MTDKKRKLKYVTLIWEELPESMKVFIIPTSDIDKTDSLMLRACHMNYVNSIGRFTDLVNADVIDEALIRLMNMLTDPNANWINEEYKGKQANQLDLNKPEVEKLFGRWFKYMTEPGAPMTLPRSKMFRSGYLM